LLSLVLVAAPAAVTLVACGGGGSATNASGDDASPEGSTIDATSNEGGEDATENDAIATETGADTGADGGEHLDSGGLDAGDGGVRLDGGGSDASASDAAVCTGTDVMCSGGCTDTQSDHANCGGCGKPCGSNQVCAGGSCHTTCGTQTTCLPDGGAPYCANTATDNNNCGACGTVCGSGTVCSGGKCGLTCGSETMCTPDGGAPYCADTTTENDNCGTCGNVCAGGDACKNGMCQATCATGDTACNGTCTNTLYDPLNCGGCNKPCSFTNASAACGAGTCVMAACTAPYKDCDHDNTNGCEVNVQGSDPLNCGACGHTCGLGETCSAGTCTFNYTTNLLGWWQLNDAPGSTSAADSSGNNLPGRVAGAVTFVAGAGTHGNGAALFPGGNPGAYIDVAFPNNAVGQGTGLYMPLGNVTYAMWFKTATTGQAVQGLQAVTGVAWGSGWDRIVGNGAVGPLNYNSWNEVNFAGVTTVNDGNWHHVVYVLDETKGFAAYVDGVLDGSSTGLTSNTNGCAGVGCSDFNWASDYVIGTADAVGSGRFNAVGFNGYIEDVRVYSVPLTQTGVTTLYNATK
jgi:hypothetical protein